MTDKSLMIIDPWPVAVTKTAVAAMPRTLKGDWIIRQPEDIEIDDEFHHEWKITFNSLSLRPEILHWCKEAFGPNGNNRKYSWRIKYSTLDYRFSESIFLRNAADVTMFRLRWM